MRYRPELYSHPDMLFPKRQKDLDQAQVPFSDFTQKLRSEIARTHCRTFGQSLSAIVAREAGLDYVSLLEALLGRAWRLNAPIFRD